MCNFWQLSVLSASYWAAQWAAGWATGWQMGAARATNSLLPSHTLRIRTPLLSLHVSTLKPNPHAGQSEPYAMQGGPLRLVPHD